MAVPGGGVWRIKDIKLTEYRHAIAYGIAAAASKNAGQRAVRYAREELAKGQHNDTGLLSHSIKSRVEATPLGPSFYIYSDVEYSRWVNDGTGIYGPYGTPIVPRSAAVLRFMPGKRNSNFAVRIDHRNSPGTGFSASGGGFVYSYSVQGQPATKFMDKAMARIKITDFIT